VQNFERLQNYRKDKILKDYRIIANVTTGTDMYYYINHTTINEKRRNKEYSSIAKQIRM